jgi:hypothetical protein
MVFAPAAVIGLLLASSSLPLGTDSRRRENSSPGGGDDLQGAFGCRYGELAVGRHQPDPGAAVE